jgi:hypothetical protein
MTHYTRSTDVIEAACGEPLGQDDLLLLAPGTGTDCPKCLEALKDEKPTEKQPQ